MDTTETFRPPYASFVHLDRLFEGAKKNTIIQLRWPLVILCCYLLLYSPEAWLPTIQTHAILLFYLLTNVSLYLIDDDSFASPYFYGPLLFFDTVFIAVALAVSGGATSDFYIACFFTLLLSCICNDPRGLLVITFVSPLLYGYVVFHSSSMLDASAYLRLPFPMVIAIFYGYFAQVERMRRVALDNAAEARRQQQAAEEIRRNRDRLAVLHDVNLAVTSTIEAAQVLSLFLHKALAHLPYAAAIVRLRNPETGAMETIGSKGVDAPGKDLSYDPYAFFDSVIETRTPLLIADLLAHDGIENPEWFCQRGLVAMIGVPLVANGEALGSVTFLTREERSLSADELGFLSTLAGHTALAVHHAQLFDRVQRQADELRNANKVKDEFLGVVSHELRTPLNVISGYTNMLLEAMLGEITPIQEKALETIARQSRELHSLINSVLQVSSIEADMLQADIHEVNLWEFVSELRSSYDYPLGKDLALVWDFPTDLPVVCTDRGKLKHILENLINNAIKFTDQGSVTISGRYLPAKKTVLFKVSDTGVGIPKDQLPNIFERFRQVDSSDTRAHGGVGLGLYIVKRFMNLLEGTIQVDSQPGQGTTFTVRIPCGHQPSATLVDLTFAATHTANMV